MPIIIVSYRYSTAPDLMLDHQATWTGPTRGRSVAAIASDLRGLHHAATDVAITGIAWEANDDQGPGREAAPEAPPRLPAAPKRWGAEAGRKALPPARLSATRRGGPLTKG